MYKHMQVFHWRNISLHCSIEKKKNKGRDVQKQVMNEVDSFKNMLKIK